MYNLDQIIWLLPIVLAILTGFFILDIFRLRKKYFLKKMKVQRIAYDNHSNKYMYYLGDKDEIRFKIFSDNPYRAIKNQSIYIYCNYQNGLAKLGSKTWSRLLIHFFGIIGLFLGYINAKNLLHEDLNHLTKVILFGFCFIICFFLLLSEAKLLLLFLKRAQSTEGKIIKNKQVTEDDEPEKYNQSIISFKYNDTEVRFMDNILTGYPDRIGKHVKVLYDFEYPNYAFINRFLSLYFKTFMLFIFCVAICMTIFYI